MKKIVFGTLAATIAGAAAWAGGLSDAIVESVPEAMPVEPTTGMGWIIPVAIMVALVTLAVAGGDDDDDTYVN